MTFRGDWEFSAGIRSGLVPPIGTLHSRRDDISPGPETSPWSALYLEPKQRNRSSSHIVFGRVSRFSWQGTGLLSLKTAFEGSYLIASGGGLHQLAPKKYLVLNRGQEYATHIESDDPVDALSVFLEPNLVLEALESRRLGLDAHLEGIETTGHELPEFFERCFDADSVYSNLLQIRREIPTHAQDRLWLSERLHAITCKLVDRHYELFEEVGRIPAIRKTTQEELYRRLYKARDFAEATIDQEVSLNDLAYVACLSTNYFLRSFRALFGVTPHQFVIEKRIEKAQRLLKTTKFSVSEICHAVGFQSLGSFSWLFKKRVGVSPEAYRKNLVTPLTQEL